MRILVAEDQPELRRVLVKNLTAAGYTVDGVPDGEEALAYLDTADYDVAVLDIMMPKVNGLTVLRTLRGRDGQLPVLLLTARDAVADRVDGLDAGADDYLIKPFALDELLARLERKDVRFYIVGDGSLRKQLEQKAAALGIREHVTFTGFLQDVEKIEAALDIAVITSKAEALCLSILESMIAGIPAVGTDSGGVAEVILHGENGFLIPVGDSDALAERLDELLTDDATRSAFGAQAKRDAEATFLAEQMTRKIEKLYLEAGK